MTKEQIALVVGLIVAVLIVIITYFLRFRGIV